MQQEKLDEVALKLGYDLTKVPPVEMDKWIDFVDRIENAKEEVRIALVGKYVQLPDAYKPLPNRIQATAYNNRKLKLELILSDKLTNENIAKKLAKMDGILVTPGFGTRGVEGKICALQYARENNIPCFGIGLGMQTMAIEFARNVLDLKDANSTEMDATTAHNIIDIMYEQKYLRTKAVCA